MREHQRGLDGSRGSRSKERRVREAKEEREKEREDGGTEPGFATGQGLRESRVGHGEIKRGQQLDAEQRGFRFDRND